MDNKSLVAIIVCGVIVASMIFGAYQIGLNNSAKEYNAGKSVGYAEGYKAGSLISGNSEYSSGYQAGMLASENSTIGVP